MKLRCPPNDSGIKSIVEEEQDRCTLVSTDRTFCLPTFGTLHVVRGNVESIDLHFGEVMSTGYKTLYFRLWEAWEKINKVLLPSPGNDRTKMISGFVGGTSRVRTFVGDRTFMDPIQEFSYFSATHLFYGRTVSPLCPFLEGRQVFFPCR